MKHHITLVYMYMHVRPTFVSSIALYTVAEALHIAGINSKVIECEVGEDMNVCAREIWCKALSQLRNFTVVICQNNRLHRVYMHACMLTKLTTFESLK